MKESRFLSNTFKWIAMQWPRSVVHSTPGFSSSVFQQSRSVCNESKIVFPLFSKTFSSAVSSDENETEVLAASKKGKSQKGLYWKVSIRPKAVSVLEKWLNDGNELTQRDVMSIVRSLRQHGKYAKALEVSEWMQNYKKFEFEAGDYAIQLDLIAKVHGVSRAEKYFGDLPDFAKNEGTYCTLLHCYCKERLTEKAEQWMGKIQELGFDKTVLPYNTLMDLYIANGQMEKVVLVIEHLKKMDVQLDSFTYSLWISACASMSGIDDVEKIVDEIKAIGDDTVSWTIYSALANMYIKAGLVGKAESSLKELENKISKRDRRAYDYLITMHASLDNKEAVYRIWQSLKTSFDKLNFRNYVSVLASLIKVGDVEGAEKIFEEWESSGSRYDYRIPNILLAAYVRGGMLEKAENFHGRIIKKGGKPICRTWEILTEGYIESKQMDKAVITMMKALSRVKSSDWKPRSKNVMGIFKYFEEQGNVECADAFLKLLRHCKCVTTEIYNSLLSTYAKAGKSADKIFEQMVNDNVSADEETNRLLNVVNENPSV